MDDCVHLQQAAGTTIVGYNAYYDHKLAHIRGLTDFSGSRANKEFWVHDMLDTEKDILKVKAHDKLLSSVSGKGPAGGGSSSADGGPSQSKSSRSRHNKNQHQLYQKIRKAKKAEQWKQAKASAKAPDAAAVPTKSGQ